MDTFKGFDSCYRAAMEGLERRSSFLVLGEKKWLAFFTRMKHQNKEGPTLMIHGCNPDEKNILLPPAKSSLLQSLLLLSLGKDLSLYFVLIDFLLLFTQIKPIFIKVQKHVSNPGVKKINST